MPFFSLCCYFIRNPGLCMIKYFFSGWYTWEFILAYTHYTPTSCLQTFHFYRQALFRFLCCMARFFLYILTPLYQKLINSTA